MKVEWRRWISVGCVVWWLSSVVMVAEARECGLAVSNAYAGRTFWVCALPDAEHPAVGPRETWVNIIALEDATVWVDIPAMGWQLPPFQLKAGESRTLSPQDQFRMIVPKIGTVEYAATRIRSSGLVVVSVESFPVGSEGLTVSSYLAYPVSVWGKHYVFAGYYDNPAGDYPTGSALFPQGFYVISKEQGTSVQIRLRGPGWGWIRINGQDIRIEFPRDWDKLYRFTLEEGQVLTFGSIGLGNVGSSHGEFDLSGTEIIASKPVGVIAYNVAAVIPYLHEAAVDWESLTEMVPPVGVWGRRYITRAFRDRGPLGGYGEVYSGDNYRVVALEANTTFTVRWYDPQTGQLKGEWSGLLQKAGEYKEYVKGGNLREFIEGYAVWEADKPVMVVQYGGVGDAAVFLWAIPVEQYLCEQVGYQWEDVTSRLVAHLLIAAEGEQGVVGEVEYNGEKLKQKYPPALWQQVPGTGYWAVKLAVRDGVQWVRRPVPVGMQLAGLYDYDAGERQYGHTLMAWNRLDKEDTEAPRMEREQSCGNVEVVARDDSITAGYEDTGISRVALLSDRSWNYRLRMMQPQELENRGEGYWRQVRFRVEVIDPSRDGKAVWGVVDWRGNVRVDSVVYAAPRLRSIDTLVVFDTVRVGQKRQRVVRIVNGGDSVVVIDTVRLVVGEAYRIVGVAPALPVALRKGDTVQVAVVYEPKREREDSSDWDWDTVVVQTECATYRVAVVAGQGVVPRLVVGDWDARTVEVGQRRCNREAIYDFAQTVRLRNEGSAEVVISRIEGVEPPFEVDTAMYQLPIRLGPGEEKYFKGACFAPVEPGEYAIEVRFVSNGGEGSKEVSRWRGRAIGTEPYMSSYDWGWRRRLTVNAGVVEVGNAGQQAVRVEAVGMSEASPHFRIVGYRFGGVDLDDPTGVVLDSGEVLEVWVEYEPQEETGRGDTLRVGLWCAFLGGDTVRGELRGQSYEPKVGMLGYRFGCVELGEESEEVGEVKIWNADTVAGWPLMVWGVELVEESAAGAFRLEGDVGYPVEVKYGDTLRIGVRFVAKRLEGDWGKVEVRSDAGAGPGEPVEVRDTVQVEGCAIGSGRLEVEGLELGRGLGCDEGGGKIEVRNAGRGRLRVEGIEIVGGDEEEFVIEGPKVFELDSGEVQEVGVRMLSGKAGRYAVEVEVRSDIGRDTVEVAGERYGVEVAVGIGAVGEGVVPGEEVAVGLWYRDESGEGRVERMELGVRYEGKVLGYEGVVVEQSGVELGVEEEGIGRLRIEMRKAGGLESGRIGRLRFRVYGGEVREKVGIEVEEVEIGDRSACVEVKAEGGEVELGEYCLWEVREIELGGEYGIVVRELGGEELEVEYGVGIGGEVEIGLYDGMGKEVKEVERGKKEAGRYRERVWVGELGSGLYFVVYRSGRYRAVVPVWVR